MNLLVISDIDDFHWSYGSGRADILLCAGDVDNAVILEAAQAYQCSTILAVKGNHDSETPFTAPIVDLHLQVFQYQGLSFGGLEGSWRYKPQGYFLYEQSQVQSFLATFPPVDVFLAHNSPSHIHDRQDEVHIGFEALNRYIQRAQPRLLFHGHQHLSKETQLEHTRVIGVFGYGLFTIDERIIK